MVSWVKKATGREGHSQSAPLSLGHLTFVAPRCFSRKNCLRETCAASPLRALDCPPISRRSKGSSPSDDGLLLAHRTWITFSRSHNETTFEGAPRSIGHAAHGGQIRVIREDSENFAAYSRVTHETQRRTNLSNRSSVSTVRFSRP